MLTQERSTQQHATQLHTYTATHQDKYTLTHCHKLNTHTHNVGSAIICLKKRKAAFVSFDVYQRKTVFVSFDVYQRKRLVGIVSRAEQR